jgi:hypothetical protein
MATSEELMKGYCQLIKNWAKLSKTGIDPFALPDFVMGHVDPKTQQSEVLVGGIPVFRTYVQDGETHCRLITFDWEQL